MRNVLLGLALLPYLAAAGADAWMHERARRVPRVEQWLHGGLAVAMAAFLAAVFLAKTLVALTSLAAFVLLLAWDEFGFHRALDRRERLVHAASWVALAAFVGSWWALDSR